ncbi:hypothetical protein EYF80_018874 [Liparis tanakae]|uniref:Uncharacterized protein n=1 Tax=Liparis tanakae TaxID=230148 RepID=A0A4Z2HYG0_9TELE|nr:hypothetical protein EYF80_018874 [Liparis tanakae]
MKGRVAPNSSAANGAGIRVILRHRGQQRKRVDSLRLLGGKDNKQLTLKISVHLNRVEDGLQHRENITEEEVPGLCQGVNSLRLGELINFSRCKVLMREI